MLKTKLRDRNALRYEGIDLHDSRRSAKSLSNEILGWWLETLREKWSYLEFF